MTNKNLKKEETKEIQDVEIYLQEDRYISLLDGTKVKVPKLAFGKEIKMAKLFSQALKKVPKLVTFLQELGNMDAKDLNLQTLATKGLSSLPLLLPEILDNVPDVLAEAASVMLDKDIEWVMNNLDADSILELVVPFFVRSFRNILNKVSNMGALMPEVNQFFSA